MDFNWIEYLYLAQELLGELPADTVTDESKQRAAISRAYYAAFKTAYNFLYNNCGLTPTDYNKVHLWTSNELCNIPAKRKLGRDLDRLKDLRKKADYDTEWPVNLKSQGTVALIYAKRIISALSSPAP